MYFYQFPKINHIDDIIPHLNNKPEIMIKTDSSGFKLICYNVVEKDTFGDIENDTYVSSILRECRGISFDMNGNIISRKLHKFFNVNERDETRSENIQLNEKHYIMEKLDGSSIVPIFINEKLIWTTKKGNTDTSSYVYFFSDENKNYEKFSREMFFNGITPTFEYLSLRNKIVIRHEKDRLVLLSLRNNITGEYFSYESMVEIANKYNIEVVKVYDSINDIDEFISSVKTVEEIEGYILRFHNGHMLKFKTEWYITRHKLFDDMTSEKNVLRFIISGEVDDILPTIADESVKNKLIEHNDYVNHNINNYVKFLYELAEKYYVKFGSKKNMVSELFENDKIHSKFIFDIVDNKDTNNIKKKDIYESVKILLMKSLSTFDKIDSVRYIIGDKKWIYHE